MNSKFSFFLIILTACFHAIIHAQKIPDEFVNPPHKFSVMPFWFWNDTLKDEEIIRQIADFETHGVYGFVIRPGGERVAIVDQKSDGSIQGLHYIGEGTNHLKEESRRSQNR